MSSNEIFISNSDNELEQVHLDLHLSWIVGHIETRHPCPLKSNLENTSNMMDFYLDFIYLLIRDLLVKLGDKPHILLLSILFHPRLLSRHLRNHTTCKTFVILVATSASLAFLATKVCFSCCCLLIDCRRCWNKCFSVACCTYTFQLSKHIYNILVFNVVQI